ncbi:MAG: hypothetical protein NT145_06710 [Elusimicrobia bacterium]|nr:hypothetical protein [Elusimicrobiota bacterium]
MQLENKNKLFDFSLVLSIFLLFSIFIIKSYTGDALLYVCAVGSGWKSFHPHHLLFNLTGFLFHKCFRLLGYSGGALYPMQIMNAIFGSLTVYFFYLYAKSFLKDKTIAVLLSFVIVFSYGFWLNVSNPEVYISTLFFIALSLLLTDKMVNNPTLLLITCSAISTSLSMLYHQISIFFFFFAIFYILLSKLDLKNKIKTIVIYSTISFVLTAGVYMFVGYFVEGIRTARDFNYWLTRYAHQGEWGIWHGMSNIKASLKALFHVFYGGGGEEMFLKSLLKGNISFGNIYLTALFAGMAVSGIVFFYFAIKNFRIICDSLNWKIAAMTLWILMFGAFNTWWDPGNSEFALFLLFPLILIMGFLIEKISAKEIVKRIFLGIFVSFLFVFNFFGFIMSETKASSNGMLLITDFLKNRPKENQLILNLGISSYREMAHYNYFVPYKVDAIYLSEELKKANNNYAEYFINLKKLVDLNIKKGYKIYVDSKMLQPSAANIKDLNIRHPGLEAKEIASFVERYDLFVVVKDEKQDLLYQITGLKNEAKNKSFN